jgi:hypothetical protein
MNIETRFWCLSGLSMDFAVEKELVRTALHTSGDGSTRNGTEEKRRRSCEAGTCHSRDDTPLELVKTQASLLSRRFAILCTWLSVQLDLFYPTNLVTHTRSTLMH